MKLKKRVFKGLFFTFFVPVAFTLSACSGGLFSGSGDVEEDREIKTEVTSELPIISGSLADSQKLLDILLSNTNTEMPSKYILYISGIDLWGDVSTVSRSDVNLLVAVNRENGKIALVNTPRDSYVKLPQSGGTRDKLTHAGLYGIDCSKGALENLYGIKIDYYLRLNFTGFCKFIDALGGIDVYSEQDFEVVPIKKYKKGINHLSGIESLAFVRERKSFGDGDYQRGRHQMQMAKALVGRLASFGNFSDFEKYLQEIEGNYETDMPDTMIKGTAEMEFLSPVDWKIEAYTTMGTGSYQTTYSIPSQALYVTDLNNSSVDEAAALLKNTMK